ncbi:type I restriction modification DNA specificity domain protein [Phocaeicola plebeius DSM 17135]|uniref:Type I restriction modification DNA specificity domain protein n=3 Tax=Phocaeicola TaxID=909656 RepID=B5D2Q8_PHOPM|nr:restriction endonuclease subunit S [Phocaeicola plebeius]EDY93858.1 type I restriction modification DNA specificity domain protein [Phocaeicola plebeius DSM 17135]
MNGKQLKNSILQWAIQGKLVPQDPNDEPASVLLERIRAEKARLVKEKKIKKDKNESIIYRGDDNSYYEKFLTTGEVKCIDEEIPFEIPKGWEWARINAIGVSQLGKTLDRGKESGKEYPYLCSINVYWDSINLSKIKTFRLRDDELPKYKLRKGDLLICEGGDYGRCCIWDRNEDMYYQNALHRVRFHGGLIPSFYKYVFELYRNIGYIVGQGQTIKHFTYENMRSILFPVPSIHEQKRIVSRIEEIQPIVKKYQRTEDALKRLNTEIFDKLKKSILQEAIQGKLVSQITEEGTAQELLKQIKTEKEKLVKKGKLKKSALTDSVIYKGDDNKYWEKYGTETICVNDEIPFEIPATWIWVRLDNICSYIQRGKSPKYSPIKKYPVIAQKCNQWAGFCIDKAQFIDPNSLPSYSEERLLQDGDLMWNSTGLGTLGRMAIYQSALNPYELAVADSHVTVIRPLKEHILSQYLYYYFASDTVQSVIEDKSDGSTKQKELSTTTVKNYLVPIPPYREQQRIVEKIKTVTSIMSR